MTVVYEDGCGKYKWRRWRGYNPQYLMTDWLCIVRKDKGAESLVRDMKKVYSIVETVEKKKGFHIIKACK